MVILVATLKFRQRLIPSHHTLDSGTITGMNRMSCLWLLYCTGPNNCTLNTIVATLTLSWMGCGDLTLLARRMFS